MLAAGLCRIFKQDGYKVAPFKSQNMALNSYITEDGLEMGRAQVMQAEAAGVQPVAAMNPILLKPTNDIGSQVILNGEVAGVMSAAEYFRRKQDYIPVILDAFHTLEKEYDMIVVEGAGSPAEINLKENDIVNMGLAEMLDAPVLLVGDIDRGGVFAQLVGTMELLEADEKARIVGTVINKFRGDVSILEPGLRMLEEKIHRPVLGVIPYFHLDLDEEDSLTERFDRKQKDALIDIAVIRFPRISNFTDLMPLECLEGVSVRYVTDAAAFGNPDAVILPGVKHDGRSALDAAERIGSKSFEACFGRQDRVWNLRRIPDARRTDFRSGTDGTWWNDPWNGSASDFHDISAGEEKNAYRGNLFQSERNVFASERRGDRRI